MVRGNGGTSASGTRSLDFNRAGEDKVNAFLTLSGYIEATAGHYEDKDDWFDDSDEPDETDWMSIDTVGFIFSFDFNGFLELKQLSFASVRSGLLFPFLRFLGTKLKMCARKDVMVMK